MSKTFFMGKVYQPQKYEIIRMRQVTFITIVQGFCQLQNDELLSWRWCSYQILSEWRLEVWSLQQLTIKLFLINIP